MLIDDLFAEKQARDASRASAERARRSRVRLRQATRKMETMAKSMAAAVAKQRAADLDRAHQLLAQIDRNALAAIRGGRMTGLEASRLEIRMHQIGDELRRYQIEGRIRTNAGR